MKNRLMQLLRDNAQAERRPLNLVRNEAASEATLYVYDVIDAYWGVSAAEVIRVISGLSADTTLNVRFKTPGGDVFEGRAIAAALQSFPGKVVGHVDALCASAGTTIACACDEVVMGNGAFYMVHNAWTLAMGNKSDLRQTANLLEKVDGEIIADYARVTGASVEQIAAWMDAETWFTAQEAVDNGFAARVVNSSTQNAETRRFNLQAYGNAPKALLEPQTPEPTDTVDWAALRAANERRLRLLEIA